MGQHAAPEPPPYRVNDQTADLAECIESAMCEVIGESPLIRMLSLHAARSVQFWIDFQLQAGTLRPTPTTVIDVEATNEIPGVRWRSDAPPKPTPPATESAAPTED